MIGLLLDFWPAIVALLGGLGLYLKGRSDASAKAAAKDAAAYRKTRERMDDAQAHLGDDPAVLRDALSVRDPNQR